MAKINITFPVKNAGNIKATNVIGTVTDPVDVSFVKASTTKGSYNSTSKEWSISSLLAGESAELHLEYNIDDLEQFPFTFNIGFTSDQSPDSDPSNDQKTVVVEREDVFPCPDCPPPSVELNGVIWEDFLIPLDVEDKCLGCELLIEVVSDSEQNIDSLQIDSVNKTAKVKLENRFQPWSFQIEASCINCPYWCGESNEYGPFGPVTVSGEGSCCDQDRYEREEFEGLDGTDTITLGEESDGIKSIFRNGLLLLESTYLFDGVDEIQFNDPFVDSEEVVVIYKPKA